MAKKSTGTTQARASLNPNNKIREPNALARRQNPPHDVVHRLSTVRTFSGGGVSGIHIPQGRISEPVAFYKPCPWVLDVVLRLRHVLLLSESEVRFGVFGTHPAAHGDRVAEREPAEEHERRGEQALPARLLAKE